MNLFRYSRFAIVLLIITAVSIMAAAEPKPVTAEKVAAHSQLVIKLQGAQLEFFGLKDNIDNQRKEFEKKAEAELSKRVTAFQSVQAEYEKMVEELRKESGAAPECKLDENARWKCPEKPPAPAPPDKK